jgi:hypothetical protein
VNKPITSSTPQTISIAPAAPSSENSSGEGRGLGGKPKNFCVPWASSSSPDMMRSTASMRGA